MTEPKPSNLTFESRIGKPAKNRRDRTGERFGDWKVTGYGGSNGHDSWWRVENVVTGERAEKHLTTLVGIRKRAESWDLTGMVFGEWEVSKKAKCGDWRCKRVGRKKDIITLSYRQLLAFEREAKRREARSK